MERDRSRPMPPGADRFESLCDHERLLVWSVRYAAACRRAGRDPLPMLRDVFRRNRAEETAFAVLRLVAVMAHRGCGIRCTACPTLSGHERSLVEALRDQGFDTRRGGDRAGVAVDGLRVRCDRMPAHVPAPNHKGPSAG